MENDLKCTADKLFDRPICPIMSHQYLHSSSTPCAGENCVFCRGGDCLIAKSLETYIKSKDPFAFISDEDLNEIELMA